MKGLWTRTTTQHFPSGQLYLWHECHSWHNLAEFCEIHLHWLETILTSEQATCFCFRKLFQNERTRHKSRVYPSLFYLQHIQILQEKKKKAFSQRIFNSKTTAQLWPTCWWQPAWRPRGRGRSKHQAWGRLSAWQAGSQRRQQLR